MAHGYRYDRLLLAAYGGEATHLVPGGDPTANKIKEIGPPT
jgi:hypothetical protein